MAALRKQSRYHRTVCLSLQPSNRLGWWCCCTVHWFHTDLKTVRAHLFQTGYFYRETFSTLRNILAIDCSTKKCEYSFALRTRYDYVSEFVGQNRFFHFVWDPQPKVRIYGGSWISDRIWLPKMSYALLFSVFMRVANVHFVLHAFVRASQSSYMSWSYAETFRCGAVMTTPGLV